MNEQPDIERLEATIRTRYPHPLAATFIRAYYEAPETVLAVDYLMNLFEVTLKYLTAIALAQYFRDGAADPKLNQKLLALQRPSLGHWQQWLRDILDLYEGQRRPLLVPELGEFYKRKSSGAIVPAYNVLREIVSSAPAGSPPSKRTVVSTQEFFDALGAFRNLRAHRPTRPGDLERAGEVLKTAWRELFQAMSFVADYRLIYVREVVVSHDPRQPNALRFGHRLTYLTGDLPKALNTLQSLEGEPLHDRELYLLASSSEFRPLLSLHPFWIFRRSDTSMREEAFVLNLSNGSELEYISYQSGDRFNPTEYVDYMQSLLHHLKLPLVPGPLEAAPDEVDASPLATGDDAAAVEAARDAEEEANRRVREEEARRMREEEARRTRETAVLAAQREAARIVPAAPPPPNPMVGAAPPAEADQRVPSPRPAAVPRRSLGSVSRWSAWAALGVLALTLVFDILREGFDPGYIYSVPSLSLTGVAATWNESRSAWPSRGALLLGAALMLIAGLFVLVSSSLLGLVYLAAALALIAVSVFWRATNAARFALLVGAGPMLMAGLLLLVSEGGDSRLLGLVYLAGALALIAVSVFWRATNAAGVRRAALIGAGLPMIFAVLIGLSTLSWMTIAGIALYLGLALASGLTLDPAPATMPDQGPA
jgi:hypothetical protein